MISRVMLAIVLLLPMAVMAQVAGHGHEDRMSHDRSSAQPTEPGQSAFAAIQEIVALLEVDPDTDWSRVDIAALRRHLVDMHNVTVAAEVVSEPIDHGARFTVTGTGGVGDSIRRMVSAHAATMNNTNGWRFEAQRLPEGAVLTVTAQAPEEVVNIRALGFIGVMTKGIHHPAHHLMIARGEAPHR